jgi:hypothetical protein
MTKKQLIVKALTEFPKMSKASIIRYLLDTYPTMFDDYERTTGIDIRGAGRKMDMSRMSKKLENLMIKPTSRKIKNINFSI